MLTPPEDEPTDELCSGLVLISRLPKSERPVALAKLVLGHPSVPPLRFAGLCQLHAFNVPEAGRNAHFTWSLYHALKYRPAPEQTPEAFSTALLSVARYGNPTRRLDQVAKVWLMFEPLLSGGDADRVIKSVRLHPLLDFRNQQECYELLRLAEVLLPLVREYAEVHHARGFAPPGTVTHCQSRVVDGVRLTEMITRFPDGTLKVRQFTAPPEPGGSEGLTGAVNKKD